MRQRMVDYLIDRVYDAGAHHVFFVPGSGCMFLTDALARKKELTAVSCHHEQAAGMAALTYAKLNGKIGVCVVTTGCGGTNTITAVLHAWQDNVPCVFISGQASRNQTLRNSSLPLRQVGRQEADIVKLISPITKYAVMINSPDDVAYEIDKALTLASTGRKGPVWIDVPLDIQNSVIDADAQRRYTDEAGAPEKNLTEAEKLLIMDALKNSRRPVLLVGNGVRLAVAVNELRAFTDKFRIPITYSRLGHDLIATNDPLSIGMAGMLGASRAGNFALANSDLVLSVGCHLSINTTGYEYNKFARAARLIVVDIDENEHMKDTVKVDAFIHADAKAFFKSMLEEDAIVLYDEWAAKCLHWKEIFPTVIKENKPGEKIDMYHFVDALSEVLPPDATVISDAGSAVFIVPAVIRTKPGQRSITSGAQAEMGYSLPAAIGAAYAREGKVIAVSGDGSVMMNLQELETLKRTNMPIKLCVMNNNGYASIRYMQNEAFRGRIIGCDPSSGITFPNFEKIAHAFGLQYVRIEGAGQLTEKISAMLELEGPVLCEVICVEDQELLLITTVLDSKKRPVTQPLENLSPFIDKDLFEKEMVIEQI